MLFSIKSTTSIDHVALIEPDGTAHYENGDLKDLSHRNYFKEGISGQRILSDPVQSSVDHETRVILGVPVLHNSSVIGVLGTSYNITALNHLTVPMMTLCFQAYPMRRLFLTSLSTQ